VTRNPLKKALGRLLRYRPVGKKAAALCKTLGALDLSRRISRDFCGFVPEVVDFEVPSPTNSRLRLSMYGVGGLDQVARMLWWLNWGGYEKPVPDLFAALSRDARAVFDVGAYTGFYAMVATSCNMNAQVFAFEPYPLARGWLEKNIALNALAERVHVIPCAVSDQAGEADFYVPTTETGLMETASSLASEFRAEHLQVLKVPVLTLDEFKAQRGCGPIDLMKIDVETLEHRVLRGARRILLEDRPIIFLEILGGTDCGPLESLRIEAGYVDGVVHEGGIDWRDQAVAMTRAELRDHVFCPEEKSRHLSELVESLHYNTSHMNL
jgi:FkbM family methyltransferase